MSDLTDVLARLEKIEKGPWRAGKKDGPYWQYIDAPGHEKLAKFVVRMTHFTPDQREPGIAHNMFATTLLPELIAVAKAAATREETINRMSVIVCSGDSPEWADLTLKLSTSEDDLTAALSALAKRGKE